MKRAREGQFSSQFGIDADTGQSGQAVGTLRDARPVSCSRADTEIASDRGGQCRIKKSHADQREAGDGRIVCSRRLFVSPAQECNKNDGSGGRGPANEQSGRKGRKGHCRWRDCTGTKEEAGRGTG